MDLATRRIGRVAHPASNEIKSAAPEPGGEGAAGTCPRVTPSSRHLEPSPRPTVMAEGGCTAHPGEALSPLPGEEVMDGGAASAPRCSPLSSAPQGALSRGGEPCGQLARRCAHGWGARHQPQPVDRLRSQGPITLTHLWRRSMLATRGASVGTAGGALVQLVTHSAMAGRPAEVVGSCVEVSLKAWGLTNMDYFR